MIHGRLTRLTIKNLDFCMGSQLNAKRNGDFRRETGVSRIRSHPWSFWASDNSSSRFLASQIMNPHFGDFWSCPAGRSTSSSKKRSRLGAIEERSFFFKHSDF